MKKTIIYSLLSTIILFTSIAAVEDNADTCDIRSLRNELLKALRPDYKYDSAKTTRFKYTDKEQVIEIEAPLLKSEKFRFLFNTSGLSKDIEIKFYEKKGGPAKNKNYLFSLNDIRKEGQNVYTFEPSVSKKIYLNYIIPRTSKYDLTGCMVCVIGYKISMD